MVMREKFQAVLRVLMLVVVLLSGAFGYMVYEKTLAEWWIPVGMAAVIAMLTFPAYRRWKWLTTEDGTVVNFLCHLTCVGVIAYALFLSGNYYLSDAASLQEEEVVVQRKYQQTRKQTRRVGRHRYVADGVRKEYYLSVLFGNGMEKDLRVSLSVYNRTRMGGTRRMALQKGFFGLPVVVEQLRGGSDGAATKK